MILLRKISVRLLGAVLTFMVLLAPPGAAADDSLAAKLTEGGHVLMIRHAYAPGSGDPADFTVGDCTTQRTLNDRGRDQARAIGDWLRSRRVASARVYSSQWCRCLETAELLGLGPVTELPALNSFFQRPQDREPNLAALRRFLADQVADGSLIVLVTHFVTISAIAGQGVSSGDGVVLQLDGHGGYRVVAQLGFDS
jgi:phosphohistidine phosphatase SixA